jgi:hypothetical protein
VSYHRFILSMDRSPGFGSTARDSVSPCSDSVSLRLRRLNALTLPRTVTRRPVLQKVRGRTSLSVLPLLVNTGFQVLFHSPPGVLFTFPSRYSFTIGHQVVFSLGGWSPLLPTGFPVSRGTPDPRPPPMDFAYGTLTPFGRTFQSCSAIRLRIYAGPLPPRPERRGFGLFPVRSPLLGKSMFLSLPPAT